MEDRYRPKLMEQVWAELVGEDRVRVRGIFAGSAVRAELRIIEGSLDITELHVTLDGGFLPKRVEEAARSTAITSDTVRSISFERIHQEARDLLARRLPPLPADVPFTADELGEAAESRMSEGWRERIEIARSRLVEDRSRRGRPTDVEGLKWLARRYVELDHDRARPALRRTLAEEATRREGAKVSEATIAKRLRRATELGLLSGREASRRGGSRLGPGYYAINFLEGTT